MTTEEAYQKFWGLLGEDERSTNVVDLIKALALLVERIERLEADGKSPVLPSDS